MRVFTCEDRFEAMMTCIYDSWAWALKHGHDKLRLQKEPIYQPSLLDEYVHVDSDIEKSEKVVRSVCRDISKQAYLYIFYATLSADEDALDAIYKFLRVGFANKSKTLMMYDNPYVMRMFEIKRKVGNELHYFKEFTRFNSIDNKIYVSHIEPKCDVSYPVSQHFADRMPGEYWMIIDDNRKKACIHPVDGEVYIRYLTDEELETLKQTEQNKDEYSDLWKTFFRAIGIKERENYKCQRNMFPLWMRKHVTEFMDD